LHSSTCWNSPNPDKVFGVKWLKKQVELSANILLSSQEELPAFCELFWRIDSFETCCLT